MSGHTSRIAVAETEAEIARCYEVMRELRPHFATCGAFVAQVQRQQEQGYQLVFVEVDTEIRAVAGYRIQEFLFQGLHLYVDDLVTRASDRSAGYGGQLFDWLVAQAEERGCATLELDSGVQRFAAHRFYLRKRMQISSHHFSLPLE